MADRISIGLLAALVGVGLAATAWDPAFGWLVLSSETAAAEPWRLVTGHFVHVDAAHLLANLAALAVLLAWARAVGACREASAFVVLAAAPLGAWLAWGAGLDGWYAGLSGLLHGLVVLVLWRSPRPLAIAGSLVLAWKLGLEQWIGVSLALELSVPVRVDAHLAGALAGAAWLLARACASAHIRVQAPRRLWT